MKNSLVFFITALALSGCQGMKPIFDTETKTPLKSQSPNPSPQDAEKGKLTAEEIKAEECAGYQEIVDFQKKAEHDCFDNDELKKQLCENKGQIDQNKNAIEYEKYLGKKSGFVDAGKIYEATKDLDTYEWSNDLLKKSYKRKTKKKFNFKDCPKP